MKQEILVVIETAQTQGVSERRTCGLLQVNRRRLFRWRQWRKQGRSLENRTPGPEHPAHALLPSEQEAVLTLARREEYADWSHRSLTVLGWDEGWMMVSFSTTYRILKAQGLIGLRGNQRRHNGRSAAPVRKELDGPNQRWCWDISYLKTDLRGVFLYLYLLLDEWSRKALAWRVSGELTAGEAQRLLDAGVVAENILEAPQAPRPEVINDRGRQMRAKPVRQMLSDLEMPQLFARPRTPNDNPFIEAMFSTTKGDPRYPERFRDQAQAHQYCAAYFPWYNTQHYHSALDYVTPAQAHAGQRPQIVAQRRARLATARAHRKEVNRSLQGLDQASTNAHIHSDLNTKDTS
jgi:transposase InsO family protein